MYNSDCLDYLKVSSMNTGRRSIIGWSLLVLGGFSLFSAIGWKVASNPSLMSSCTIFATEPEEHGDFRIWQPLQAFEWESAELEIDCGQVQRKVDVEVREMVPFIRPFNQYWTMSSRFGQPWTNDFNAVRLKDSDPIDHIRLGNFITKYKLECRYSPVTIFPWARDGITKCRINQGSWEFFYASLEDSSQH
jgi:hypothetical protein